MTWKSSASALRPQCREPTVQALVFVSHPDPTRGRVRIPTAWLGTQVHRYRGWVGRFPGSGGMGMKVGKKKCLKMFFFLKKEGKMMCIGWGDIGPARKGEQKVRPKQGRREPVIA